MDEKPDTISVEASAGSDLEASAADVDLQVQGSSFFTGDEAFKKAKELRELSETLTSAGLEASKITIQGIQLSTEGLLGWKSSSCQYKVRLRNTPAELLSKALGAVAAQKGVTMTGLTWRFGQLQAELDRLRKQAMAELLATARQLAELLQVDLLGIHSLHENVQRPGENRNRPGSVSHGDWSTALAHRVRAPDLGMAISSKAEVILTIAAEFRESAFQPAS